MDLESTGGVFGEMDGWIWVLCWLALGGFLVSIGLKAVRRVCT